MLKKMLLAACSIVLVLTMSACAAAGGAPLSELVRPGEEAAGSETEQVKPVPQAECDDNLDGMSKYFLSNSVIKGDKIVMSFDVIGAKNGYKYNFKYNSSTVQIELYEYDLENLNEAAKTALDSAKSKGKIKVLEKEIDVIISDSGKYLMVYSDKSKEEKNKTLRENTETLFKGFKAE